MNRAFALGVLAVGVAGAALLAWRSFGPSPSQALPGVDGASIPRLSPHDAQLDQTALAAAADAAFARGARALVVGRRGHVVYERYADGMGPSTPVALAADPLLALALGIAIDERIVVSLDAPIAKYLPEAGGNEKDNRSVQSLLAPPDVERLGLVLTRASGESLPEFLSKRVWVPLGASDARLESDGHVVVARIEDWLRVGEVLAANGVYQGEDLVPPGWVPSLEFLAAESDTLRNRNVLQVDGAGGSRLWIVPAHSLVILQDGGAAAGDPDDDGLIPIAAIGSVLDARPSSGPAGDSPDPADLVPEH